MLRDRAVLASYPPQLRVDVTDEVANLISARLQPHPVAARGRLLTAPHVRRGVGGGLCVDELQRHTEERRTRSLQLVHQLDYPSWNLESGHKLNSKQLVLCFN